MAIPRANRQPRQPQYQVTVDTANPITRGLVRALVCEATGIRDLMLGTGISVTGTYIPQATESGYGRRNNTITRANYTLVDARTETVSAITIVWAGVVHRVGGTTYPFFRNQQTIVQATSSTGPLWSVRFGVANTVNSTTPIKIGAPTTYVYRKDGAIGSLFVDGVPALLNITGGTGAHSPAHGIDGNVGFAQSNDITTNVMLIYDRPLSDAESQSLSINPWQVFRPVQRRVYFDMAAGGATGELILAAGNASQLNSGSTGSIELTHELAGSASSQDNAGSAGAMDQALVLVGASSVQANSGSTASLSEVQVSLTGAASAQANAASAGAISQSINLQGGSDIQANTGLVDAIVQAYVLGGASSAQSNLGSTGQIILGDLPEVTEIIGSSRVRVGPAQMASAAPRVGTPSLPVAQPRIGTTTLSTRRPGRMTI